MNRLLLGLFGLANWLLLRLLTKRLRQLDGLDNDLTLGLAYVHYSTFFPDRS
jgi:hypothetical protein